MPAELGAVIARCLKKEPAKRYQTVQDLRAALEAVRAVSSGSSALARGRRGGRHNPMKQIDNPWMPRSSFAKRRTPSPNKSVIAAIGEATGS